MTIHSALWLGIVAASALTLLSTALAPVTTAQSVASGTLQGTVVDPSGAVVVGAKVEIRNPLSGYRQGTVTDASGAFRFNNVPFNNYHMETAQTGFAAADQDVNIRSAVPLSVRVAMTLAGVKQSIAVEASVADIVEKEPYAHNDVNLTTLERLPTGSPASGLSDAVTLTTPGVAADSNGFFHPLGDHAQTSFSVDGQPVNDQQSKAFSTQLPVSAIQSMELITGTPRAEYGDKTSLIVNTVTRSGLGVKKPTGSFVTNYGSFGTVSEDLTFGAGTDQAGYFGAANILRSGRFLDTPESAPIHAIGNGFSTFHRIDVRPGDKDSFHFNILVARNAFGIPNTLDNPNQDQHQKVQTFNFAPGYQHVFDSATLLTINPFVRHDRVQFDPSAADAPLTLSQLRELTNAGVKADLAHVVGKHNIKVGGQIMQTRLKENFTVGITDALFNAVCVDGAGAPQEASGVSDPAQCSAFDPGFQANPDFNADLLPYDRTRGGASLDFNGAHNINQYAFYLQDDGEFGRLTVSAGLRIDRYDGLTQDTRAQPRLALSYLIGRATVLRVGYARTMETPYNENLLLASTANDPGVAAFTGSAAGLLDTGHRNQYNLGIQQGFGKYVQVDGEYFWKFTDNAFDFGVIDPTPLAFPISWAKSKLDGFSLRVATTDLHGFQAYMTMGHARARYLPPGVGGSFSEQPAGVFRIDHDQKFQHTTNVRYQFPNKGWFGSFTWRYDSGLVAGAVGSLSDALALTGAQQAAIGFFCGATFATPDSPITDCPEPERHGATRLVIPAEGTADDDHNPPRIAARHLFDIGFGTEDLLRTGNDRARMTLKVGVTNLTNKVALYNFLSTFSGTHFVTPRAWTGSIGVAF